MTPQEPPPIKHRFLQFSLRQLLVLLAVLGMLLAILAPRFHRAYREQQFQDNFRKFQEAQKNLVLAVRNNDLSLARRALDAGADPDQWLGDQSRLLHIAIGNGHLAMAELLLDYGADIERSARLSSAKIALDGPPLFAAISCTQPTEVRLQMIRLLVQRGANPRAEVQRCNAMDFLVYGDRDTQVGDLLREIGVPYGPREMAAFNRLDDLKRAVGEQPDLVKERFRSPFAGEGPTLLGIALEKGHRDMAKFLIEAGAPLDTVVYQNMTLLHMAARGGDPELIRLLVARGLDVHARDRYQDTPLRDIAWAGKPDAIAALLEAGADVNTRGMNDYTPLHTAVSNNRVEIVRMLLAAGADATIPDSRDHETALDVARRKNGEYAKWPANRPLPDSGDGAMPLDVARKKNSDIVKLLEEAVRTKPPSDRTSTK